MRLHVGKFSCEWTGARISAALRLFFDMGLIMQRVVCLMAALLATAFPAHSASIAAPSILVDAAALATADGQARIAIDPRVPEVAIDGGAIARLAAGQIVSVAIAGVGNLSFVIDYVHRDAEILEIGGHAAEDAKRKITLGVRADGVTGLIDTPTQTYALGYADRVQMAGPAGSQWMAEALAGAKSGVKLRAAVKGDVPPAPGAEPMLIDLATLSGLKPGDEVVMQLTGLGAMRVRFEELRAGDGSATWVGYLKDFGENYKVLLTYSPDATEGYVLTPKGEINLLSGANGDLYQFNPAEAGYRNAQGDGESCAAIAFNPSVPPVAAQVGTATGTATPVSGAATTGTAQTIDVLVYYTPGMVAAYGSVNAVATRVDALIAAANQAYLAGGLDYRIRRVGLDPVAIDDRTTNDSVLSQMNARSGAFGTLNARRDQLGADLVTVIRPLYAQAQGSCGVGYVSGYGGTNVSLYGNYGLSVLSDGNDHAGQSVYCDALALAHELGHNMGLMHDRATVAKQGGGSGVAPYAFGYAVAGRWGTIMSYTYPHQVKFSNPNDYSCGARERCGLPETDPASAYNVKALSLSMPLVAAFRPDAGAQRTFSVTGVATLDGKPAAGVVMSVGNVASAAGGANAAQVGCQASGGTGVYSCSAPAGYSFTLTPSYPLAAANTTIAWTPASATVANLSANRTLDFSGKSTTIAAQKYVLSIVFTVNGQRTIAIPFTLQLAAGSDVAQVSCVAGANTTVACSMPKGYSAKVTPSANAVWNGRKVTFAPAFQSVANLTANAAMVFTGTAK